MLEEYKALRAEVLTSMQTQQGSLGFGTAALGILAAGGFNAWEHDLPAVLVFLAGLPTLSGLVVIIWMGELTRMQRAGAFVKTLEGRINAELAPLGKGEALSWEHFLRQYGLKLEWNYRAIVAMFAVVAFGSLIIGTAKGIDSGLSSGLVWVLFGVVTLVLGALTVFVASRWRTLFPSPNESAL